MYDAKWNILGESEVHLINADTGKPETYKVIFDEVTDPRKLDNKGRPIKIGEKVRIVDPQSGKDIIEPVEDINEFGIPDAIQKAYKKLGE